MSWVPDNRLLSELSLPGTHDTMARYGGDLIETQELNLYSQLTAGIRFLDIRVRQVDDTFAIHHGISFQNAYFDEVLRICNLFLAAHPKETILMSVSGAGVPDNAGCCITFNPKNCTKTYDQIFSSYRNSDDGRLIRPKPTGTLAMPTLGEIRGKIVILQDIEGLGLDEMNLWNLSTIYDRDNKWEYVFNFFRYVDGINPTFDNKEHLNGDITTLQNPGKIDRFYRNGLNGSSESGGVYPNAVARYVNPRALAYLFGTGQQRTTAIVSGDFMGGGLISAIVGHNMKYIQDATGLRLLPTDFAMMMNNIAHSPGSTAQKNAESLKRFLGRILPAHHWGVIATADLGSDNWGYSFSSDGLSTRTDEIGGITYVVVNGLGLNSGVSANDLTGYLTQDRMNSLTGDAASRAGALASLVRNRFPGVHWNVAVKRTPVDEDHWGATFDASAATTVISISEGRVYQCAVWATSRFDSAPAVVTSFSNYIGTQGDQVAFSAAGSFDPEGGILQFRWDVDGDGVWDTPFTSDPTFTYTYWNVFAGKAKLEVSDGVFSTFASIPVIIDNFKPTIIQGYTYPNYVLRNTDYTATVHFEDPGHDFWSVDVLYGDGSDPIRAEVNQTTHSFTLNHRYPASGSYKIQAFVFDNVPCHGGDCVTFAQDIFTLQVLEQGRTYLNLQETSASIGSEGSPTPYTFWFSNVDWTPATPVLVNWGDGSPVENVAAAVTPEVQVPGSYRTQVTHIYADNPPAGQTTYPVTVSIAGTGTNTGSLLVLNAAPVFANADLPTDRVEGQSFSSYFQIADPGIDTWTLRLDFGDGDQVQWPSNTRSGFTPSHAYKSAGTYTIVFSVTDNDGGSSSITRTVTVQDAAPQITSLVSLNPTIGEGQEAQISGLFTSQNLRNDTFNVQIDWGDGGPSSAAFVRPFSAVNNSFAATHVYRDNKASGPYVVTATVTDHNGSTWVSQIDQRVTNRPPVILLRSNLNPTPGVPFDGYGRIQDPGADTFTGQVDFGDGNGFQPLPVIGSTFQLDHVYATKGERLMRVQVTDKDGATASAEATVVVGPPHDLVVSTANDSGDGSLRAALAIVNTPGSVSPQLMNMSEIHFAPELDGQTIVLTSGGLQVVNPVLIDASNLLKGLRISGNNASRILTVGSGGRAVIQGLHFYGGRSVVPGFGGSGGALAVGAAAALTLNNCTVSDSTAGFGGGAVTFEGGRLLLNNCTFTRNTAVGGGVGSPASGGALDVKGTLVMTHCTVVSNTCTGARSDYAGIAGTVFSTNSIIAANSSALGHQLPSGLSGTGNFIGADPQLFPLGNYDGPTPTMPPMPGSPVIDSVADVDVPLYNVPLVYWRMGEEDAGAAAGAISTSVTSRLGAPLELHGVATYRSTVSDSTAGWLGGRLSLQLGAQSYGTSALATDLSDNFGIQAWVRPEDVNITQCLAYNGSSARNGWGLYLHAGRYKGLFGGVAFVEGPLAVAGEWTHLALVRAGGISTLFVNGVPSATSAFAPAIPSGIFAVGVQPQTLATEYFTGLIDEVQVFSFNPGQFSPDNLLFRPQNPAGTSHLLALDQRGLPRVSGSGADAGAVEVQQSVVRLAEGSDLGTLGKAVEKSSSAGIITFAPLLSGRVLPMANTLNVAQNQLLIDGGGLDAGLTLDGGPGAVRILRVQPGGAAELRDLHLTRGNALTDPGVRGGGAVLNSGTLRLDRCTFSDNRAANGGALMNLNGSLSLIRCTLSGNSATIQGGAIMNTGTLLIQDTTLTGNSADAAGTGLFNVASGVATLANTLLAGNTGGNGADVSNDGQLTRVGANLIGSAVDRGTSSGPSSVKGTPLLAPLGSYGGLTPVRPPLPGSAAIDAGSATGVTQDQRGATRVLGDAPDIGSVEAFAFSTIPLVDADGDGADDRMELGYFGNLTTVTRGSDHDGDGSSDVQELSNMTNPLDPVKSLRISRIEPTPGFHPVNNPEFDITVSTFPGLRYGLQQNPVLNDGFADVAESGFTATRSQETRRVRLLPGQAFVRARRD